VASKFIRIKPLGTPCLGTVGGLSQASSKPKMVAELKEMLQMAAYRPNSGSDRPRESCKEVVKAYVVPKDGCF